MIKLKDDVVDFLKLYTNIILEDGSSYYYIPSWFEDKGDNMFIEHSFKNLPNYLKNFIKDSRG